MHLLSNTTSITSTVFYHTATGQKKYFAPLLILFFSLLSLNSKAAVSSGYNFSTSAGTYTAITGGGVWLNSTSTAMDDVISEGIPIGHDFCFNGSIYNFVFISTNGFITFGTVAPTTGNQGPISSTGTYSGAISAFGCDANKSSYSSPTPEIRYQDVTGSSEFVVQWQDMGRYSSTASEKLCFQIRLNYSTNVINIVYGGTINAAAATSEQPQIGLRGTANTDYNNRTTTTSTDWSGTTAGGANSSTVRYSSTATACKPASGRTFTWTPATAMTYSSCTAAQASTASTSKCGNNQEIINIQIVTTTSYGTPLTATQFQINMTGSSAATSDVSKIHIYYTGTSSIFSTENAFDGTGTTPAAGTITINGSQSLQYGTNYFWVAYDINTAATTSNVVDAQCTQLTVSASNKTPTTTSPAGTRSIVACAGYPGGRSTNLSVWLKADAGTSTTVNGNSLTTWSDQSGRSKDATGGSAATFNTNVMNFNPGVTFSSNYYNLPASSFPTGTSNYSFYYVFTDASYGSQEYLISYGQRGDGSVGQCGYNNVVAGTHNAYLTGSWCWDAFYSTATLSTNTPYVGKVFYNNSVGKFLSYNGYYNGFDNTFISSKSTTDVLHQVGGISSVPTYFNAKATEIIAYSESNSGIQQQKIESYLALKYGITLSNNFNGNLTTLEANNSYGIAEGNYVLSEGTVAWSASANSSYHNDVAGLCRNDESGLNIKVSTSVNTTPIVQVALENDFSSANNASSRTVSYTNDKSALIWGSDGGGITFATTFNTSLNSRMTRIWKRQLTNTAQGVYLKFTTAAISNSTTYYLIGETSAAGTTWYNLASATSASSGNTVTFGPVTLSSKTFFTLANTPSALPVDLLSFNGIREKESARLEWFVASEVNNNYFTLERSFDNLNWTELTKVKGAGNSTIQTRYTYYDNHPKLGVNYYRLSQTDFDGKSKTFNTVAVNFEEPYKFFVAYEKNSQTIFLNSSDLITGNVTLYNTLGQNVFTQSITDRMGAEIPAQNLANGVYYLRFIDPEGLGKISKVIVD